MGLVSTWLTGIGLAHAVPNFRAAGIVNPSDLAELELSHYEALGVTEPNDRKKLFYLVQRVKMAVDEENGSPKRRAAEEEEMELGMGVGRSARRGGGRRGDVISSSSSSGDEDQYEEDYCSEGGDDEDDELVRAEHKVKAARGYGAAGEASETASVSSGSSEMPSPPPSEDRHRDRRRDHRRDHRRDDLNGDLNDSYRSVGSRSAATADGRRRSSRLMNRQLNKENRSGSRTSPKRATGQVAKNLSVTDEFDDHSSPPSSRSAKDENGTGRFTRSKLRTGAAAAAESTSTDQRKSRPSLGVARGSSSSRAAAAANASRRGTADDDDSDWDDLLVQSTTKSPPKSRRQAEAVEPKDDDDAAEAAADHDRGGRDGHGRPPPRTEERRAPASASASASARRTSRRLREKQRRDRGSYGLQSLSRSFSAEQSGGDDDDDGASVGSMQSQGSSASSVSARGRRRNERPATSASALASPSSLSSSGRQRSGSRTDAKKSGSARGFDDDDDDDDDDDGGGSIRSDGGTDQSSSGPTVSAASSSKPRRKMTSRIPNPTVSSSRTGKKRLSTIPSERVAPMSPLLKMSSAQLEKSIGAQPLSVPDCDDEDAELDGWDDDDDDDERSASSRGSASRGRARRTGVGGREASGRRSSSTSRERKGSLSGGESSSAAPEQQNGVQRSRRSSAPVVQAPASRSRSSSGDFGGGSDRDARGGRRQSASSVQSSANAAGKRDVSTADSSSSFASRRSRLQTPSEYGSPKRSAKVAPTPLTVASSRYERVGSGLDSSFHGSLHSSINYDANASIDLNESVASGPVFVHGLPEDDSFKTQIARLREDNAEAHEEEVGHLGLGDRAAEDDEEEMRIRVIVRKRPMSGKEAARADEVDIIHPLDYDGYGRIMVYQPKTRVDLTKEVETLPFAFDNVFDEGANNTQIYERAIRNLIPGVFEGRWASCFAYGQTGSGKTFTMMGSNMTGMKAGNQDDSNFGLYYLAAQDVFFLANEPEFRHLTVGASLFEIYGGKLFDLLNTREPIKCMEDHRGKVCFPGLSEHLVASASELMDVIEAGAINRSTGTTSANADSSRSHAVLQLSLRKKAGRKSNIEHGRLTFIDLAGSERGADTNKASRTTRMEGAEINTSLLALKEVIRALATGDSMKHIPFRGSKLTQVLKESFVGKNSRSVMVACVAPNMGNCEHTLNTLRYADRVKERDANTGKLTAAVARASRIHHKKKGNPGFSRMQRRPLTAPASSRDLNTLMSQSDSLEAGRFEYASNDRSDYISQEEEEEEEEEVDEDELDWLSNEADTEDVRNENSAEKDSVLIGEVLDSSTDSKKGDVLKSQNLNGHSSFVSRDEGAKSGVDQSNRSLSNKETAKTLVSTHRAIMTEMLSMVKHEMTLVNCTDADRETIEEYLVELEKAQEKQLSMISTLREALLDYYGSRETSEGPTAFFHESGKSANADEVLSDDSFEDLRD